MYMSKRAAAPATPLDDCAVRVVDAEDRIQYWNPGAERLYGWSEPEALGRRSVRLLSAEEEPLDEPRRRLREVGSWCGELREVRRDGSQLVVACRFVELRPDGEGKPSILVMSSELAVS